VKIAPAVAAAFAVASLGTGCVSRADVELVPAEPRADESDFVLESALELASGGCAGTRYEADLRPKLLVVGQCDVEIELRLTRPGFDFPLDARADSFAFRPHTPAAGEIRLETDPSRPPPRGVLRAAVAKVTPDMTGYWDLVLTVAGREMPPVPYALRVVPAIRVALTFDDGPSVEEFHGLTSTDWVLDTLQAEGIKAAFFVLTTADRSLLRRYPKAETPRGLALLVRELADGHVVACHWGGKYRTQYVLHPGRVPLPPYDSTGDGSPEFVGPEGNALESDLLECAQRIALAGSIAGPAFVRPPLWTYKDGEVSALPTYAELGLKMILTDAHLFDGGYAELFVGRPILPGMAWEIESAVRSGHSDIVVTMHDSNARTAEALPRVLACIRKTMRRLGYEEDVHWHFTKSTEELLEILERKRRFHLNPRLLLDDTRGGD